MQPAVSEVVSLLCCVCRALSKRQLVSSLLVRLQPWPVNHIDNDRVTDAATQKSRPPPPSFGSLLIKRSTGAIFSCPVQSNIQRYCKHLQLHQKLLPEVSSIKAEIACPSVTARVSSAVSFCRGWDKKSKKKKEKSSDDGVWGKHSIDFMICLIWSRAEEEGREAIKIRMRSSGGAGGDKETRCLKRCVYHLI